MFVVTDGHSTKAENRPSASGAPRRGVPNSGYFICPLSAASWASLPRAGVWVIDSVDSTG